MWIAVSVTPWSVAPLAVPGPHGDGSVPNMTVGAAVVVGFAAPPVVGGAVELVVVALRLLLHAASDSATSPTEARTSQRWVRDMRSPLSGFIQYTTSAPSVHGPPPGPPLTLMSISVRMGRPTTHDEESLCPTPPKA